MKDKDQANLSARYKANIDKRKVKRSKAKSKRNKEPLKPYGLCLCGLKNTTYFYATQELLDKAYMRLIKDHPGLKKLK